MRRLSPSRLPGALVWLVPALAIASLWLRSGEWSLFFVISVSLAAMNLLAFSLPRGDVICMQGGVVVAAVGLVSPITAAYAVVATALVVGLESRDGEVLRPLVIALARSILTAVVALGFQAAIHEVGAGNVLVQIAILGVAGLAFMFGDLMLYGLAYAGKQSPYGLRAGESLIKVLGAGYTAQISVGLALVLVYPRLEMIAFVVLIPLMAIMQHTTGMLLSVRAAYMRTIGALARVAEMQAGGSPGHAERVSQLASQLGHRMHLDSGQMERLALSAVLHDIGRLRDSSADTWERLAGAGAEVLARISFLAAIAPVLSKMPLDYGAFADPEEPDGRLARIVRACSDYDDLLSMDGFGLDPASDALHRMLSTESGYDPTVLQHLRAVVGGGH